MLRILAVVLALILGLNGLFMLFGPFAWYNTVPGVPSTGAFNPHFVRDIGVAYLAATLGVVWFLARPRQGWPVLVASAGFLVGHAGIHVFDASCSASGLADAIRDLPGVYLTALAAAAIAGFARPRALES
jgi:uncharacterized protein YjeT (DUF2065 family)